MSDRLARALAGWAPRNIAPGLEGAYVGLAPDPDSQYGQILPFARDENGVRFAMPEMVRNGLKGALDLANSTYSGSLTGDALGSMTMGSMGAGATMAPRGALAAGGSIKAYHGSPHNFDRFDSSKIGTGEGAQAYGHGLYFAENEGVAKSYKMAGPAAYKDMDRLNAHLSYLAREMDKISTGYRQFSDPVKGKSLADEYDALLARKQNLGHMYEVRINADPERFLNRDRPLGGQSQEVIKAVQSVAQNAPTPLKGPAIANRSAILAGDGSVPGDVLYNNVGGYRMPAETSNALREAGIPGIRYLDGGSRSAGDGSHNYVVFPGQEDLIEILRKYALAAPAPVAPPSMNPNPTPDGRRRLAEVLSERVY